ncbi:hypothetical protein OG689_43200 [Kitasatospora sp. NBC_00240]|uniref:hypothetical protein n=1 Tax=Kitasatospora sp. NBC_00240 TaxID=2903567 RepID=UPI00224E296D|nr:hypothetical protein [Kitasatospora sp. NBC_00240]MCX5215949.1 hypothetical protein [Kitasatospora sp. NBC_00240]
MLSNWQMYVSGRWVDLDEDPAPDNNNDGDWEGMLKAAGFSRWTSAGTSTREGGDELPLDLRVYNRHGAVPGFAIDLMGYDSGETLTAYAATLADVMELLAQWAPAVQALAATDLLTREGKGRP